MRRALTGALCALLLAPAAAGAARRDRAPHLRLQPCRNVAGALCGTLKRPLDPAAPRGRKIAIGFLLYRHTRPGPAAGTIVAVEGGPGYATTESRASYRKLFAPLRRDRDLLLMDLRGTGRSGAIDCRPLQSYPRAYVQAVGRCGRRLGPAADLYASGYAADDLDALRAALGIGRIDLYGDSYGTFFAQAYAVRHGERLRSLVLDAAYPIEGLDPWWPDLNAAFVEGLRRTCARSPACAAHGGDPAGRLAALTAALRARPYTGRGRDADGARVRVRVDEGQLAEIASGAGYYDTVWRELDAAGTALRSGDRVPLTRLAAELHETGGFGDPREYSQGLAVAVSCTDYPQLWDVRASFRARRGQYAAARAALPAGAFAPFSVAGYVTSPDEDYDQCLEWPAPRRRNPPRPPGAAYPAVPALVLVGDLDDVTSPSGAAQAAAAFPRARFVEVRNVGHVTALDDAVACGAPLVRRFVRTLDAGATACARATPPKRVLAAFPLRVAGAQAASPAAGDRSLPRDRRAVTVAALTVADALARWPLMEGSRGAGLRGGSFRLSGGPQVTVRFRRARFSADLAVGGTARWDRRNGAVVADLRLAGRGADRGRLALRFNAVAAGAIARAQGVIGGRRVAVTLPAP